MLFHAGGMVDSQRMEMLTAEQEFKMRVMSKDPPSMVGYHSTLI